MARKQNKALKNERKTTSSVVNIKKGGKVIKKQPESKQKTKPGGSNAKCPKCSKSVLTFNKGKVGICSSCLKNEVHSSTKSNKSVIRDKSLLIAPKISTDESSRRSNRLNKTDVKRNATQSNLKKHSPAKSTSSSRQLNSPKTGANSTRNNRVKEKEKVGKKNSSGGKGQTFSNTTKTVEKQQLETITNRKSGNKMNLRGKKRSYAQLASGIDADNTTPLKKNRNSNKEAGSRGSRSKKPTIKGSEWINKIQSKKPTVNKDEKSKNENVKSPLKIKSPKLKVSPKKERKNISSKVSPSNTTHIKSTVKRDCITKQKENVREFPKRQISRINVAKQKNTQSSLASKKHVQNILPIKTVSSPKVLQRTRSNIIVKRLVKEQGISKASQTTNIKHEISKTNLAKSIQKKFSSFTSKNKLVQTDLKDNVTIAQEILQDILNSVGSCVDDKVPSKSENIIKTEVSNVLESNIMKTLHVENIDKNVDEIGKPCKTDSLINNLSGNNENKVDIKLAQTFDDISVDGLPTNLTSNDESKTHLNSASLNTDIELPNSLTRADEAINLESNSIKISVDMSVDKSSSSLNEIQQSSSNNNFVLSTEISIEVDNENCDTKINIKDNSIPSSIPVVKNDNYASQCVEDSLNNSSYVKEDVAAVSQGVFNKTNDGNVMLEDKTDMNDVSAVEKSPSKGTDLEQNTIIVSESIASVNKNADLEINISHTKTTSEISQDCHESKEIDLFSMTKSLDSDIDEEKKSVSLENNDNKSNICGEENISSAVINYCADENNVNLKKEDLSFHSFKTKISNSSNDNSFPINDSCSEEILNSCVMIETSSRVDVNNEMDVEHSTNEDGIEKESITLSNERCIVEVNDKIISEKGKSGEKENDLNLIDSVSSQNVGNESEHTEDISCNISMCNKENNPSIQENTVQIVSDCGKEHNKSVSVEQDSNSQPVSTQDANFVEGKTVSSVTNNIVSTKENPSVCHEENTLLIPSDSENLYSEKTTTTCVKENITITTKLNDDCKKEHNISISVEQDSCNPSSIKDEGGSFVENEDLNGGINTIGCKSDNELIPAEYNQIIPNKEETLVMKTSIETNVRNEISSTLEENLPQVTTVEYGTKKGNNDSIMSKECDSCTSQPMNSPNNENTSVTEKNKVMSTDKFKNVDSTILEEDNTTMHSSKECIRMVTSTQSTIANEEEKNTHLEVVPPAINISESDCRKEQSNSNLVDKCDSSNSQLSSFSVVQNKSVEEKTNINVVSQDCITKVNSSEEDIVLKSENSTSNELISPEENVPSSTMIDSGFTNKNKDNLIPGECGDVIAQTIEGSKISNSTSLSIDNESCASIEQNIQCRLTTLVEEDTSDCKIMKPNLLHEKGMNTLNINTDKESNTNEDEKMLSTTVIDSYCTNETYIASHVTKEFRSNIESIESNNTDKENSTPVEENIPNTTTTTAFTISSTNNTMGKENDLTIQPDKINESTSNDNKSKTLGENTLCNDIFDDTENDSRCITVEDCINGQIQNSLDELNVSENTPIQENKNGCTLNDHNKVVEENTLSNNIIDGTEKVEKADCKPVEDDINNQIQNQPHKLKVSSNAGFQEINSSDNKEDSCLQVEEVNTNSNVSIVREQCTDLSADIICSDIQIPSLQSSTHSIVCEEESTISGNKTSIETPVGENSICNNVVDKTQTNKKADTSLSVEGNINDQVQNAPNDLKVTSSVGYQEINSNNKNEESFMLLEEDNISLTLSLDEEECTDLSADGKCSGIDISLESNTLNIACEQESILNKTSVEDSKQVQNNKSSIHIDGVNASYKKDTELKEDSSDVLYDKNRAVTNNMEVDNAQSEDLFNTSKSLSVLEEQHVSCSVKTSDKIIENPQLEKLNLDSYDVSSNQISKLNDVSHIESENNVVVSDDISTTCLEENKNVKDSKNMSSDDKKFPMADLNQSQIITSTEVVKNPALPIVQDAKNDYKNHVQLQNKKGEDDASNDFDDCDSTSQNNLKETKLETNNSQLVSNDGAGTKEIEGKRPTSLDNSHESTEISQNGEFTSGNDNCCSVELKKVSENTDIDDTVFLHKKVSSSPDIMCIGDKSPSLHNPQEDIVVVEEEECLSPKVEEKAQNCKKSEDNNDNVLSSGCQEVKFYKCPKICIETIICSNNNAPEVINIDAPSNDVNDSVAAGSEDHSTSDQAVVNDIEREHQSVSSISQCNKNDIVLSLKHSGSGIIETNSDNGKEQPQSITAEQNSDITKVENTCSNNQLDNVIGSETEKCKSNHFEETIKPDSPKFASEELILISHENISTSIGELSSKMEVIEDDTLHNSEINEVQMKETEEATPMEIDSVDNIDNSLPASESKANEQTSMEVS